MNRHALASFMGFLSSVAVIATACGDSGGFKVGAVGDLELRPAALEFLSDAVPLGEDKSLVVEVANNGSGPVMITAMAIAPADAGDAGLPEVVTAAFSAALPITIDAGDARALTVTYTHTDELPRTLLVTLTLEGARAGTANLPIRVRQGEARLSANPSAARFEAGSDETTTTVTLLDVGTRTLWLSRIALRGDDSFKATFAGVTLTSEAPAADLVPPVELPAGTSLPLVVDFVRRSATPVSGEVVLWGDAPNTLDGFVVPLLGNDTEPCILARPSLVTFGDKSPDTINDIPIEIENCGHGDADVTSILMSTAADAADPALSDLGVSAASSARLSLVFGDAAPDEATPWRVAPGEIRTLTVRHRAATAAEVAPGQRLSDAGFVIVRSNAQQALRVIPVTAMTRGELPPSQCELSDVPAVDVDPTCLGVPRPGTLEPAVRWGREQFAVAPSFSNVMMTPVVGNLSDDNGDGRIDASDVADVVITRFANGAYGSAGVLTALSGDDGRELWSIPGPDAAGPAPFGIGGVALGDLDGNGRPEICVQLADSSLGCFEVPAPGSADTTPRERFQVPACAAPSYPTLGMYPAIADVDGDGRAEVIYFGCVVDAAGQLVARTPPGRVPGVLPFAANIDADPGLEIVDGGVVYDTPARTADGTVATLVPLYDLGLDEGRAAVGDFDHDGRPEIVVSHWGTRTLRLFDPDGASDTDLADGWQVQIPMSNSPNAGGPPTVADFDGDGELEIGIASELGYVAFDTDGSVLWTAPCIDQSSRQTGSSVFDFDGDGAAEVLYADEEDLRIFDGATGSVRFVVSEHGSGTGLEYPVIADVNRDGRAEIVLASNNYYRGPWNGVHVLAARDDTWSSAPPVWNQHAYMASAIRPDLSVPAAPPSGYGTFRAAEWADATPRPDADLQLTAVDLCPFTCDAAGVVGDARVHFQVGNGGLLPAAGTVQIREGSATGPLVALNALPEIASGAVYTFETVVSRAVWGDKTLVAVVATSGGAFDCRGDNDVKTLGGWPWATAVQCP